MSAKTVQVLNFLKNWLKKFSRKKKLLLIFQSATAQEKLLHGVVTSLTIMSELTAIIVHNGGNYGKNFKQ